MIWSSGMDKSGAGLVPYNTLVRVLEIVRRHQTWLRIKASRGPAVNLFYNRSISERDFLN